MDVMRQKIGKTIRRLHFSIGFVSVNQYGLRCLSVYLSVGDWNLENNLISYRFYRALHFLRGIICGKAKPRQLIKIGRWYFDMFRSLFFCFCFVIIHIVYYVTAKLGNLVMKNRRGIESS